MALEVLYLCGIFLFPKLWSQEKQSGCVYCDLFSKHFKVCAYMLQCTSLRRQAIPIKGWLVVYLQVVDKISTSMVFSAVENASALGVRGAISVAPARENPV